MTEKHKIKLSIIGVGHLGNFHTRIFSGFEDVALVGVYDTNGDRCKEIADKYNTKAFRSVTEAINSADAVSVVVPTGFHFDTAMKCISAGKDLFLEKPITKTVDEAEKLIKEADKKNIILQIGHVERFNSVILTLEPYITNPRFIEVDRLGPYSLRNLDIGVVRDLMIHDIDILLHLVKSEVKQIHAVCFCVFSKTEDIANARIVFENGCVANVNASRVSVKKLRKIRIFQHDSYISIDYMDQKAKFYSIKPGARDPKSLLDLIERKRIKIKKNQPLDEELRSFVDCVKNRTKPKVTGQHGKKALEIGAEILCQINQYL